MIVIGVITSPHGVRGQFKVKPFTADPFGVAEYGPVHLGDGRQLRLRIVGQAKGLLICSADGVASREDAEALQAAELSVDRAALPEAGADEMYQIDMIGMKVRDAGRDAAHSDGDNSDNPILGKIIGFHDFGAGNLVEVQPPSGNSFLTPFGGAYLGQIDTKTGYVDIHVPAGLLDDDDDGGDEDGGDEAECEDGGRKQKPSPK